VPVPVLGKHGLISDVDPRWQAVNFIARRDEPSLRLLRRALLFLTLSSIVLCAWTTASMLSQVSTSINDSDLTLKGGVRVSAALVRR
jgi:hypothetical protein